MYIRDIPFNPYNDAERYVCPLSPADCWYLKHRGVHEWSPWKPIRTLVGIQVLADLPYITLHF